MEEAPPPAAETPRVIKCVEFVRKFHRAPGRGANAGPEETAACTALRTLRHEGTPAERASMAYWLGAWGTNAQIDRKWATTYCPFERAGSGV